MTRFCSTAAVLVLSLTADGQINLTQGQPIGVGANGVLFSVSNEIHSSSFSSPTLSTLLAACPASPTPCNVVLDPSTTVIPVASSNAGYPVTIGSTTQSVTVENRGVTLQCTYNGATASDCIDIAVFGRLVCAGKAGASESYCLINTPSSTPAVNVTSLVINSVQSGSTPQADFTLTGHLLSPAANTIVTKGILSLIAVEGKALVANNAILGVTNSVDLYLADSNNSATDNNDLIFINNVFYGGGNTGVLPIKIWGPPTGGSGKGIGYTFIGTNVGDMTCPLLSFT